jgi:nitrate reductase assembly molybdenum cofactor insertion protein NarJ
MQQQIKQLLLNSLQIQKNNEIRKKISDVISELALALSSDKSPWLEIFPFLFNLSDSPDDELRVVAMNIFGYLF